MHRVNIMVRACLLSQRLHIAAERDGVVDSTDHNNKKKQGERKLKQSTLRLGCAVKNKIREITASKLKSKAYSQKTDLHLRCDPIQKPTCAVMTSHCKEYTKPVNINLHVKFAWRLFGIRGFLLRDHPHTGALL